MPRIFDQPPLFCVDNPDQLSLDHVDRPALAPLARSGYVPGELCRHSGEDRLGFTEISCPCGREVRVRTDHKVARHYVPVD